VPLAITSIRGKAPAGWRVIHRFDHSEPRVGGYEVLIARCHREVSLVTLNPMFVTCRICVRLMEEQ
jgi:hypothetical protein